MSSTTIPSSIPVIISVPKAIIQLTVVTAAALTVYYFVGVDQGMTSVFGHNMAIHEFVHDARHFLGFPCH
jgi:hypothetical protein